MDGVTANDRSNIPPSSREIPRINVRTLSSALLGPSVSQPVGGGLSRVWVTKARGAPFFSRSRAFNYPAIPDDVRLISPLSCTQLPMSSSRLCFRPPAQCCTINFQTSGSSPPCFHRGRGISPFSFFFAPRFHASYPCCFPNVVVGGVVHVFWMLWSCGFNGDRYWG